MSFFLTLAVFAPLIGALLLFAFPKLDYRLARGMALATVLATFGMALILLFAFDAEIRVPQFAAQTAWQSGETKGLAYGLEWIRVGHGPGIRFALGLDGLGLSLFVLTTLLMVPAVFASWNPVRERASTHYALILLLQTGLLGLFAALDVVLFYVFFEFTLIPLFFLIGLYGGSERRRASITFFLYTLAGSLLTLLGVIALVVVHYQHASLPDRILTFSMPELTSGLRDLNWSEWTPAWDTLTWTSPQALIFLLLFAGFAIKVPLFPFHTWLPLAHVEAPTAGSILLAGVLLKVGGYGLLRFNLGMVPLGAHYFMPLLATLSVIGIVYGALTALAQTDVKRLVAYSSVSHMGFITLGLFSLTRVGIDGAAIQMINHGLTTGALFACVGVLYDRYHTREMGAMGGLWNRLPLLAFFLIFASLGSAAVPGLNGFVGEFPILLGQWSRDPFYAIVATTGMVLGAYYLLLMLQKVLFGPLKEPGHEADPHDHQTHGHAASSVPPVAWYEIAGLAPLMVLIVAIGVYPDPIFKRLAPALQQIAANLDEAKEKSEAVDSVAARANSRLAQHSTSTSKLEHVQ
jgi:NADH-quinone oxidoreductase subunit M